MLRGVLCRRYCSLVNVYKQRVDKGSLLNDKDQLNILTKLGDTHSEIENYLTAMDSYWNSLREWQIDRDKKLKSGNNSSNWFSFSNSEEEKQKQLLDRYQRLQDPSLSNIQKIKEQVLSKLSGESGTWPEIHKRMVLESQLDIVKYDTTREKSLGVPSLPVRPPPPKGIYLYGNVGTGKTMTMKILMESLQNILPSDRISFSNYTDRNSDFDIARTLNDIPTYSPFTDETPPPMRIVWSHFSDFLRNSYRAMHYYNNKAGGNATDEFVDAIDACIASIIGCRLKRDPPDRLSNFIKSKRLDPIVEQMMRRIQLPPVVIFFDEFQMIDIGDASVVKAIFQRLIHHGSVIITSCNLPPSHLLQIASSGREIQEFTELLQDSMNVYSLPAEGEKVIDYRQKQYENTESDINLFFKDIDSFNMLYNTLLEGEPNETNYSLEIKNYKRFITIPHSNISKSICKFTFDDLCSAEVSSVDYHSIVKQFRVIFLQDIPQLSIQLKNEVRRFISLIDQAYNQNSIIICHCKQEIDSLFKDLPSDLLDTQAILETLQFERSDSYGKSIIDKNAMVQFSGKSEKFAFTRAKSRLKEMQSINYLKDSPIYHYVMNKKE